MKRLFDFWVSMLLLILCLPICLVVAMLIRIKLGKPVIFSQVRPGLYGKPFTLYKFRSMSDKKNKHGKLLSDAERMNGFSHLLRKSSLDELPGLINVLKGDMSLVGPRPLLMQYLERYNGEQARRHDIKPGLTGWAQVNGRNAINWEKKLKMDVWYVDHHSFRLDLKILFLTLIRVYRQEGIHQEGQATAEEFMGDISHE